MSGTPCSPAHEASPTCSPTRSPTQTRHQWQRDQFQRPNDGHVCKRNEGVSSQQAETGPQKEKRFGFCHKSQHAPENVKSFHTQLDHCAIGFLCTEMKLYIMHKAFQCIYCGCIHGFPCDTLRDCDMKKYMGFFFFDDSEELMITRIDIWMR